VRIEQKKQGNVAIKACTKARLNEFFLSDEVSRNTAGKNETITRNGLKKQKRYLLSDLNKLHKKYNGTARPQDRVSKSTFYKYIVRRGCRNWTR
jgi:hypothetical protein